ncbi:hypothetical protein ACLOJK_006433 [Asimina triloba]
MINSPKSHLRAASTPTDPASHDATTIGFFLPKRESSQIWHDNGSSMARMGSSSEGRSHRHRTVDTQQSKQSFITSDRGHMGATYLDPPSGPDLFSFSILANSKHASSISKFMAEPIESKISTQPMQCINPRKSGDPFKPKVH